MNIVDLARERRIRANDDWTELDEDLVDAVQTLWQLKLDAEAGSIASADLLRRLGPVYSTVHRALTERVTR